MASNRKPVPERGPTGSASAAHAAGTPNPPASATRGPHQESAAYYRHAGHQQPSPTSGHHPEARDPQNRVSVNDLADFLNKSRVESAPPPLESLDGSGN